MVKQVMRCDGLAGSEMLWVSRQRDVNILPTTLKSESTDQSKQIARCEPVTCQVKG